MKNLLELLKKQNEEESFEVNCRLLPLGQSVAIILTLIGLSFLSHVLAGGQNFLGVILSGLVIIVVIAAANRLSMRFSPNGVKATSSLHGQSLYGRSSRDWGDLHSVRLRKMVSPGFILERLRKSKSSYLHKERGLKAFLNRTLDTLGRGWMRQGFLVMDFRSGGLTAFPLAGFNERELETLFISLSRWADPLALNPDVMTLQRDILCGQELHLDASFTKMWEDNLRHSFEVTNFVPLLGGQTLKNGQLHILMLLACGGLSSVYLARDADGDRVVIKETSIPLDDDDDRANKIHEMFEREARILAKLDHPQIVKIEDHFVENNRDYLLLQYLPGLTLRQIVQMHGALPQQDVCSIGIQIAEILEYLHGFEHPIIHRDLTPDNLIIRESDRKLTLIDFGAANEFVARVTGTMIGKQCYIPPEQFRGSAVPQSDIYATGATLFYLLTGTDPEPITTSHPQTHDASIVKEFEETISAATDTDPDKRIQSATELRTRLELCLNATTQSD